MNTKHKHPTGNIVLLFVVFQACHLLRLVCIEVYIAENDIGKIKLLFQYPK